MIVRDMRSVCSKMEDSMEKEVLLCSLTFLGIWWCYGLKWAILILFTLYLVKFAANTYHNGDILAKKSSSYQDHRTRSGKNLESHEISDPGSSGRTIRIIRRQYVNPASVKRDLTFTDLQMNRNSSPRRGSSLTSPEPLISQVTRHLSFSNVSYYPDRTRNRVLPQVQHHNTTLNTTRANNSYLLSPIKSPSTCLNDISPQRNPFLDIRSSPVQARYSPVQARYSPRRFSVLDPNLNMVESPSMVKISQPCEAIERSPLSFESILQKRLQRTKENPCSKQAVLSALVEKSRKRAASESDASFLEPTYGIKKRRRDDLDDFLDSIADSSSSPANVSSGIVKSLKRPHLHSDGEETLFTSLRTEKRLRERHSSSEEKILGSIDKSKLRNNDEDKNAENTSNNLSSVTCGDTEDSGVVLSSSDEINSEPGKTKKGKSVTFSRDLESPSSNSQNKITRSHEVHSDLGEKPCPTENGETIHARKDAEFLLGFRTCFSPRKSFHLNTVSPIAKAKEKKGHRRSHLTWKDFQENRREAWRRSQKLLDDIEESVAREKGNPSGSLVSQTASPNPSLTDGTSKTIATSINNNVKNAAMATSNLFGSTTSQGLPVVPHSTSSSFFPSTINNETQTSNTNASLQTSQPLQQNNAAGKLTLQTTPTLTHVLSSQSLPPNLVPNSSASTAPNSSSIFDNKQSGVNSGVKTAVSIATTSGPFNFAGGITGTSGDISSKVGTSEFMFTIPKSPVKKATTATTTISTKPQFGNNFTSSGSPFTGFGTSTTGTTAVVQPSTQTTTLSLSTTSSNFAPTAIPQTASTQFGFLGTAPTSTMPVATTNPSPFSFKAIVPAGTSSTALPQTTSSASTFSFKPQPGGVPTFGNTAQPTPLSSSQNRPTGLFSFTAGSSTAGVFGAAGSQTSNASSFSFPAQNGPGFGTQGSGSAVATAAGQAKPGGFSFTAPTVNKRSPIGGFNFGQSLTTPGTFNFVSQMPVASGFNFGAAGGGPGTPFASSTPMPGIAGGGSTFALGSLRSTTPGAKQRQRRRKNKN